MALERALLRNEFAALVLAVVIIVFFHRHLLGTVSFTYDFVTGYHAPTAYEVASLQRGLWPSWVSRQSLGVPLYMVLQDDRFYPPVWLFAALGIPYGLWQANVLQILHILFGGFGAYRLARLYGFHRTAIVAGVAYMLMGGFFVQSQHVDFVRGAAYAPWIFLALDAQRFKRHPIGACIFLTSIWAMAAVASYPGQVIAWSVVAPIYVFAQLVSECRRGALQSELRWVSLVVLSATLGTVFVLPKYLPFLLDFQSESYRAATIDLIPRARAELAQIFSMFLSSDFGRWNADITLRSYFVSAPIVLLVLAASLKDVRRLVPILAAAIAGILLAFDVPARLIGHIFLPFSLSRFPISEYRHFVVLGVILLAAGSLESLTDASLRTTVDRVLRALVLFVGLYMIGLMLTQDATIATGWNMIIALGGLITGTLTAVVLWVRWPSRLSGIGVLVIVIAFLIGVDAKRIYVTSFTWHENGTAYQLAQRALGYVPRFSLPQIGKVFEPHRFRPERMNIADIHEFSGRGFFSDIFVLRGLDGGVQLRRQVNVLWSNRLRLVPSPIQGLVRFLQGASSAILLRRGADEQVVTEAVEQQTKLVGQAPHMSPGIEINGYGDTKLVYDVAIDTPQVLVENEIYWQGWTATMVDPASHQEIGRLTPVERLGILRTWELPAGRYQLLVEYHEPHMRLALALMLILSMALIAVIATVNWIWPTSAGGPLRGSG